MSKPTELPAKPTMSTIQALSISYMVWDHICDMLSRQPHNSSFTSLDVKRAAVSELHIDNKFSVKLTSDLMYSHNCGCCLYVNHKTNDWDGMDTEKCQHCPSSSIWNTYPVEDEDYCEYNKDAMCEEYTGSPYTHFSWCDTCEEAHKHAKVMADELNKLIIKRIKL